MKALTRVMCLSFFALGLMTNMPLLEAGHQARVVVTVLTASNEGADFDLDNDQYRDQLIKLFSYSSYHQQNQFAFEMNKAVRNHVELLEGYELTVTLQNRERDRILVEALIRKEGKQYVNTVLSIMHGGVAFLGGPMTSEGALILVIESA